MEDLPNTGTFSDVSENRDIKSFSFHVGYFAVAHTKHRPVCARIGLMSRASGLRVPVARVPSRARWFDVARAVSVIVLSVAILLVEILVSSHFLRLAVSVYSDQ